MNVRLDPVLESPDGELFEPVIVRYREDRRVQPIFKVFPELKEYHTIDLLVFITGEEFHPLAVDRRIASRPSVEKVMMVRTRRPRTALIVRLAKDEKLEDVWKTIEDVNKASPVYARVERELVLNVEALLLKTAKGTMQRKAMGALYMKELDRLFKKIA
ncbi:hypothetical protein H2199_008970 [Coniosporium tulheliwenetii]|uniref:Uncharacterized protein n=1 Tax=Coniosporium tulheliwenetii TaxID=3383036 RepID=A0ACC2YH24_9PEZI|nr:hypothetical protein H2199_008970 [Cladosporium sp. JES 115]